MVPGARPHPCLAPPLRFSLRRCGALALILCFALSVGTGCKGCNEENNPDNSITTTESGKLLTTPNRVAFTQVPIGEQGTETLTVRNISSSPLTIFELRFEPGEQGDITDLSLEGAPQTPFTIPAQGSRELTLRYAPKSTTQGRGQIVISSSDPDFTSKTPKIVEVETLANRPVLQYSPSRVVFRERPTTAPAATAILQLTNSGTAPLHLLSKPDYVGGQDFSITVPARTYPVVLQPFDAEKAAQSPRDYVLELDVRYRALGMGADSGEILVRSNDLSTPDPSNEQVGLTSIPVLANAEGPCLNLDPPLYNLGQVPVGKQIEEQVRIESCGTEPLIIDSIRLTENSKDLEYDIDLSGWDLDRDGDLDQPISIAPGEVERFTVRYSPTDEVTAQGKIEVFSNDEFAANTVTVRGRGAVGECPVASAVGKVKGQGTSGRPVISVAPLDYVVLDGTASADPDGSIPLDEEHWEWEVLSAPPDALVQLKEAQQAIGDPRYREVRILLTGTYTFGLKVRDGQGFDSCNQAVVEVNAVPNEKISIELTWTNPEDADETNDDGSDVDLHLVKMGPGRWFESPYDIYFRNANSGAGSENNGIWNPESPSLDRDDTDGGGPETIQLDDPGPCQWYAIGVHYYSQRYGTAYATVRVYIDTKLVFEKLNVPLVRGGQFWDVGRIHWESGQVLEVNQVLPAAPQGSAPEVTSNMAQSGLCSEAMLY